MTPAEMIRTVGAPKSSAALQTFLEHYMSPAFGALPKAEVDLLVLQLLEDLGAVSPQPSVYELVSKLRVTRTKARSLIYSRELRSSTPAQLDQRVRALLQRPLIQKAGEVFVLEVENPLVADHLRAQVQALGYVADGSFSPSVVKLSLDAISALMESQLSKEQQAAVKEVLVAAGAPDTSVRGVIKASLKKLATKLASDTGEALMEQASAYLKPLLEAKLEPLLEQAKALFAQKMG